MQQQDAGASAEDGSPDRDDRVRDFLARHGGAAASPQRRETDSSGIKGRSEIFAADGYALRCDWSRFGSREEMSFTELPPAGERGRGPDES